LHGELHDAVPIDDGCCTVREREYYGQSAFDDGVLREWNVGAINSGAGFWLRVWGLERWFERRHESAIGDDVRSSLGDGQLQRRWRRRIKYFSHPVCAEQSASAERLRRVGRDGADGGLKSAHCFVAGARLRDGQ